MQDPTKDKLEDRFDMALDAAQTAAWSFDFATGEFWRSNNHGKLFGYDVNPLEWTRETFLSHIVARDRQWVNEEIDLRNLKPEFSFECRIHKLNDRKECWIHVQAKTYYDGDLKPARVIGTVRDVSSIRRAQEALIHSARMVSLGEMAGGIAHEINNPLMIIGMKTELLEKKVAEDKIDKDSVLKELQKIRQTGDRISDIIRRLQSFAKNDEMDDMSLVLVADLIKNTLALCREKITQQNIELIVTCRTEERLECKIGQMSQVLLSLLNNAAEAVNDQSEKWIKLNATVAGNELCITVTDSGTGIDPSIADKIMTPFFSTKATVSAAGLGLSSSSRIVEKYGGHLRYDSTQPNTCFVLSIPLRQ